MDKKRRVSDYVFLFCELENLLISVLDQYIGVETIAQILCLQVHRCLPKCPPTIGNLVA